MPRAFRFWASTFYFFFYAAFGALSPFLNAYYAQVGIPVEQIGILAAISQITMLFANPLWAFAADSLRLHRFLLPLTMLLMLPWAWMLAHTQAFGLLALLVFLYAFNMAPIIPLGDSAVMDQLGEARFAYGRLRIWGAVGYGLAAWIGGSLAEQFGVSRAVYAFLITMALGAAAGSRLVARPTAAALSAAVPFWTGLRTLSRDARWHSFLGAVFMAGLGFAAINNYLVLRIRDLGAGEAAYGLAIAVAGVSELPVFFFSGWMLRRWSPRGVILMALVTLGTRLLIVSQMQSPAWITVTQLLHGLTFSALWTASVNYAGELAPPGMGASAQSLLGATLFGLSGTVGALVGGQIYHLWGGGAVFLTAGLFAVFGAAIFWLGAKRQHPAPQS